MINYLFDFKQSKWTESEETNKHLRSCNYLTIFSLFIRNYLLNIARVLVSAELTSVKFLSF